MIKLQEICISGLTTVLWLTGVMAAAAMQRYKTKSWKLTHPHSLSTSPGHRQPVSSFTVSSG